MVTGKLTRKSIRRTKTMPASTYRIPQEGTETRRRQRRSCLFSRQGHPHLLRIHSGRKPQE